MDLLSKTRQNMQKVLEVLRSDIATVRTGRATPSLVEGIVVAAYGGTQKLKIMELATISAPEPQTLLITPFDHSILGEIEKGIMEAKVGLSPSNDGQVIRISIPPLSEERREQLIHLMKQKLENGRIMVRQARHDGMNEVKKMYADKVVSEDEKNHLEKEVQKITDSMIVDIEAMGLKKEEELMQM